MNIDFFTFSIQLQKVRQPTTAQTFVPRQHPMDQQPKRSLASNRWWLRGLSQPIQRPNSPLPITNNRYGDKEWNTDATTDYSWNVDGGSNILSKVVEQGSNIFWRSIYRAKRPNTRNMYFLAFLFRDQFKIFGCTKWKCIHESNDPVRNDQNTVLHLQQSTFAFKSCFSYWSSSLEIK